MKTKNGMIVGCYTLDLYCAINHSKLGHEFYETDFGQFSGRTESACLRIARKKGWLVTANKALCPQHAPNKACTGLASQPAPADESETFDVLAHYQSSKSASQ